MQQFTMDVISEAAESAGMPDGRVLTLSKADNQTIPRPRMELQWLPETFTRTGRKLGHLKGQDPSQRQLKREIYRVQLDVSANILAEDAIWLSNFMHKFVATLPRGVNDEHGNLVRFRIEKAEWANMPETRVGLDVIKVFNRAEQLLIIRCIWLVSDLEVQQMITDINLKPQWR